ncbi:ABC transporter ATP-binding protein [candidate division WOR-3 bacterium]|jgi:ABC-type lipoprotein export system ATPase subunit|nr:ABC transporter ATP-binding protein [candidate division WOR-3 bacterium]
MNNLLRALNIHKSFHSGDEEIRVLQGIDIDINKGDFISITGPSGSGKSTLLHILGGLQHPDKGEVILDGKLLYSHPDRELAKIRNERIGFIFQFHYLLSDFTVLENIMIPLLIKGTNRSVAEEKVKELLLMVDLEDRAHHKPQTLSGGERQRVAVLRAIINQPSLLLADEPTGDLDWEHANTILQMLMDLHKEKEMTIIIVTHNKRVAKIAKNTYNLTKGRLENEM